MAKKKSQPKPANKASYASKTAPRVKDATQKKTPTQESSQEEASATSTDSTSTADEDEETENIQAQLKRKTTTAAAPGAGKNIASSNNKRGPPAVAARPIVKSKSKKTRVLTEIKNLQRSTELLIPRAPFLRLVSFSFRNF
jgi:hypothetical protein